MSGRRLAAVVLGLVFVAPVRAEEEEKKDGYDVSASITAGYRLVDVDGSKPKYREDYDLDSGGRLFTLTADATARDPEKAPVDRFSLVLDRPGDEPVSTFHLSAANDREWDFRANFVRSRYEYAVPQLFENPVPGDVRLDDLHDFDQTRTDGNVDFRYHRDGCPTLILGYRLYRLSGDTVSTLFAPEGDTFLVRAPTDTRAQVGRIGTEFRTLGTDFSLIQEYRWVSRTLGGHGPEPGGAGGLDPSDDTRLARYDTIGSEDIGAPTTIVRVRRPVGDALELTGLYLYSHADLDADWQTRETVDTAGVPNASRRVRSGSATLDTHVADVGATYRVSDRVRLHFDYRFDERAQHGDLDQRDTGTFFSVDTGDHLRLNRTTVDVEVEPRADLSVRAGLRYAWRDANVSTGVGAVSTETLGAIADVRYRPWKIVDLFARYESAQVDDPYRTAADTSGRPVIPGREISLTFTNRGSAGLTVRPLTWIRLAYRFIADNRENSSFDATHLAFGNSASIVLTPLPSLSFSASYARRDLDDRADILLAPVFTTATSVQSGSEDVVLSQLTYDFGIAGQRFSTGWNVSWVQSEQTLAPRLEPGGGGRTHYDLSRIDAGAFLSWHHAWVEPGIEIRRIEYDEPHLPRNDYDATIVAFTLTRRFSTVLP